MPAMKMTTEDDNEDEEGGTFGIITDNQGIADALMSTALKAY